MCANPITKTILHFLNEIGINTIASKFEDETVLPGIKIEKGKMFIDESKLL